MKWKKLTVIVVSAAVLLGGALGLSMHLTKQQEIELEVPSTEQTNTTTLENMENPPIYYDAEDVLLLPARNVIERLGGSVKWDTEQKATEISFYGKKLLLNSGSKEAKLNGYAITLARVPEVINGCLYVSSDFFSSYFASEVIWDNTQRFVTVKTGDHTKPIVVQRMIQAQSEERMVQIQIPVVVGLNDISYEKNINEDLQNYALEQVSSFVDVLPEDLVENTQTNATQQETTQTDATQQETTQTDATQQETAQTDTTQQETAQTDATPEDLPQFVRVRFVVGYCDSKFISLYCETDVEGILTAQSFNIDLQGQKYISLTDLTTASDLAKELELYAPHSDLENYFISDENQWAMILNQPEQGNYQLIWIPEQVAKSIWKTTYQFLIMPSPIQTNMT